MKKNFLEITDPIHDFIRINKTERKIIDTSVFQRLRRIKQLSGAHLTYPGAQHTRFEHSLGVLHIASMAGESLHSKELMSNEDVQNIRFAALLHDIGHGPFSHLFEEVLQRKKQNRDKFEKNKEFSNKISQGYRKLAKKKGWKIVNASQSKNDVHSDVMKVVTKKMRL